MSGPGKEQELWEDISVVWRDGFGKWCVTRVLSRCASGDPFAPKHVTHAELVVSAIRADSVFASSKEEALLKYAASGRAGDVWAIDRFLFKPISFDSAAMGHIYRLVKEDF